MLGQRITLLCRGTHHLLGHFLIAYHTEAVLAHDGDAVLCLRVAGIGQRVEKFHCLGKILGLEGGYAAGKVLVVVGGHSAPLKLTDMRPGTPGPVGHELLLVLAML